MGFSRKNLKTALLAGVALGMLGVDQQLAFAQDAAPAASEKVTVTGTRIKQPNNTSITSTQTIGTLKIELSGEGNIVDVLRDLPIVGVPAFSSANSNFATTGNGVNTLDLRDLGTDRTLVLVNGRRFVAGVALTANVDFNSIPVEMIERVDVVSGGSSAVYGSDAIAGVVNVILKRNFEGVVVKFQGGSADHYSEKDDYQANATIGANFAEDRGNAVFSVGYVRNGPAYARSRPSDAIDCVGELALPGGTSAFRQVCGFFSSFAEGGVFRLAQNPAGSLVAGAGESSRVIDPITNLVRPFVTGTDGFDRQAQRLHMVPTDKFTLAGQAHYDFAPGHTAFVEVNYSDTVSDAENEPIPFSSANVYSVPGNDSAQAAAIADQRLGIAPDNPYIPRALLDELGTRWGIAPGIIAGPRAGLVAALMATPDAVIGFRRRLSEFGNRGGEFKSATGRFVIGAEGEIGNWDYEASFVYGRTSQSQFSLNGGINSSNWREALDVTDLNLDLDNDPRTNPQDVICKDAVARAEGCLPVDLFIPVTNVGTWSPLQLAYLRASTVRDQSQDQKILTASATGGLFDNWAGEIEAAIGGEYRQESGEDIPDALTQTGQSGGNITPATQGGFNVWEGFAELKVPLIRDAFLVKEFHIHGAARMSDYSTSTGVTKAWSADAEWIVTDGIRLRGQVGRAVRAPNLGELFTGPTQTFAPATDPCNNLSLTPADAAAAPYTNLNAAGPTDQNVIANCLANASIFARATGAGGFVLSQVELQGTGGFTTGNASLTAEFSDSKQFGFVITPAFWGEWLGNLTVSADFFQVEIQDAIATVGRTNLLNLCYQTPGLALPFCNEAPQGPGIFEGFFRDPNGALIEVNNQLSNRDAIETSGYEVQATYVFGVNDILGSEDDWGRLTMSVVWQHIDKLDQTSLAGTPLATTLAFAGTVGVFEDEVNMGIVYQFGDLTLSWAGQWMSEVGGIDNQLDLAPEVLGAQMFHDVQGSYALTEFLTVYGGVRNIGDNYVFIAPGIFAATPTGWSTEPDTYDGLGRRFFAGLKVNL